MNYDEIVKNVRLLSNDQQPTQDISEILMKHKCDYLLKKNKCMDRKTDTLNKIGIQERYKGCENIFEAFEKNAIPYAVIKGAVLSKMAYGDEFCRRSADMDLLICRDQMDIVKQILLDAGFIQGRIVDNAMVPFSRRELLFQISMSHQAAPFIKKTSNPICPYINVDVNLDIFWGESQHKADMKYVLQYTESTEISGVKIQKLTPEMEFISLCLHHYKDANSLYLLWLGKLKLSLFCDVYFYLKNTKLSLQSLKQLSDELQIADYLYYCIYYAYEIFNDSALVPYMKALKTEESENILKTFGLSAGEIKTWGIPFYERLFSDDLKQYLETVLSSESLDKIRINMEFMG